jgi:hypothetical protein
MKTWLIALVSLSPIWIGLILLKVPKARQLAKFLLGWGRGSEDWENKQKEAREADAFIASHDNDCA